ncbi:uncharacterized protein C8Q71DRAFT_860620 [Rhodofomes roseus]|uniref:Ig-like domain-containing protein n=1 Tax=Rhodofomes roseus TaxID=34475 RepID=A0ABQ8K6I1_9APHY|nr:uncharacterized protein C8Q71DRAFT_860620 [Rhodofomes roseus]KAH9832841.1 hypothetical protein C8Q71DRAFT_860620 [Rhodofomes roseus]
MACSPTVTGTTTAALTFESVSTSYSAVVVPATSPATTEALLWVSARQDLGHTPAADWGSSTSDAGWGSLTLSVPVSQTYTYTTAITSTLYGTGYPSTTLSACPSLTTTPVATGANNDAAASHARVVRGIAIGAAVAGVLALLLAIAGLIFFCTRRKPKMPAQQAQQQKTVVVRKNDDNCPHKKPLPCAPRLLLSALTLGSLHPSPILSVSPIYHRLRLVHLPDSLLQLTGFLLHPLPLYLQRICPFSFRTPDLHM